LELKGIFSAFCGKRAHLQGENGGRRLEWTAPGKHAVIGIGEPLSYLVDSLRVDIDREAQLFTQESGAPGMIFMPMGDEDFFNGLFRGEGSNELFERIGPSRRSGIYEQSIDQIGGCPRRLLGRPPPADNFIIGILLNFYHIPPTCLSTFTGFGVKILAPITSI